MKLVKLPENTSIPLPDRIKEMHQVFWGKFNIAGPIITFSLILLVVLIGGQKSQPEMLNTEPGENYLGSWESVAILVNKGDKKGALERVEDLVVRAKKEGNHGQMVKGYMHLAEYSHLVDPNHSLKDFIARLKKDRRKLASPTGPMLTSFLAESYWQYYRENMTKLAQNTKEDFDRTDISTYSSERMLREIRDTYLASLENDSTKITPLSTMSSILEEDDFHTVGHSTVFDLLSERALSFFAAEQDPSENAFLLTQTDDFAPARMFVRLNYTPEKSSLGMKYWAMEVLRETISSHLNDQDPGALVSADLHRLEFVHTHSSLRNKDELYRKALQDLSNKYAAHPVVLKINKALQGI